MTTIENRAAPRIAPVEAPYEPAVDAMLRKWMPPDQADVEPLALFRTLAVHEELMSRMLPFASGILGRHRITAREREIVIHRACALAGAEYEWGVHAVVFASVVGLTDEQLAATVRGPADDPAWTPEEALIVAMCDELHYTATVSDETWAGLAAHHGDDHLLELVMTAAWYRLLSCVINAARIQLEPWAARFPA
jgi:alkylhydroperoxidase family enzyme